MTGLMRLHQYKSSLAMKIGHGGGRRIQHRDLHGPPNLWGADDAYLVFIYGPGHDIYEGRYIICEAGLNVGG